MIYGSFKKRSPKNRTQMKPKIETSRNESLCPLKTLDHLFFKDEMSPEIGTPFRNEDDFISEKSENIKVAIRVRPLTKEENESEEAVSVSDESTVIIKKGLSRAQMFFDRVFPPETTQAQIYDMVKGIIHAVMEGYNGTVFAYGQTGTGKTHTMLGVDLNPNNDHQKGIIPRSVNHILDHIDKTSSHVKYKLYCSYLEIYNEKIYDLLVNSGKNPKSQILEIREDRSRGVYVQDLTFSEVSKKEDIFSLMERGAINRSIAATNMNDRSSRSHTVFSLHIEQQDRKKVGDNPVKVSKLNLVDLAGSEKWDTFGSRISDKRIQELTNINQSLSTLGNCISALMKPGRSHIPFRDSKLTRLLQDSLGGNTKTVFIATISPSVLSYEETHSTLKFADRAKRVVMTTRVNEVIDDSILIKRYEKEIQRLRKLVKDKFNDSEELRRTKEENNRLKKENVVLQNQLKNQGVSGIEDVVKKSELGRKFEVLRGIESDQKDREIELEQYHSWLHSIPVKYEGEEYSLDLKERLKLMENSVRMQSSELVRAKKLFMRDLSIVKQELAEKDKEINSLQTELDDRKAKSVLVPQSSSETSPKSDHVDNKLTLDIEQKGKELRSGMEEGLATFQINLKGMIRDYLPNQNYDDINMIIEGCSEALEESVLKSVQGFVSLTQSSVRDMSSTSRRSFSSKTKKLLNQSQQTDIIESEKDTIETIKQCLQQATKNQQETTRNEQYWIEMIDQVHVARSFQSRVYMYSGIMKKSITRLLCIVKKFQQTDAEKLEYHRKFLENTLRDLNLELQGFETQTGYHSISLIGDEQDRLHIYRKRSKSVPSIGSPISSQRSRMLKRESELDESTESTDSWASYDLGLEDLVL